MTVENKKFESIKELVESYLFDDQFQSDFVYFNDKNIREYLEIKVSESLLRSGDLFSGNFERKILREIKEKFLNLIEALNKENKKASALTFKAVNALKDLKKKGVCEISANTRKSLSEGESNELIDFISDSEDCKLSAGEAGEEEEENAALFNFKQEEISIKEKRGYNRNNGREIKSRQTAFAF
jgi:hypothetical protein